MELYGSFGRFIYRNEKTGECRFSLHTDAGIVTCVAVCQYFPNKLPLKISGEKKEKDIDVTSIVAFGYSEQAMFEFLCSKEVQGIGMASAKELLTVYGPDLFSISPRDIRPVKKLSEGLVRELLENLSRYRDFDKCLAHVIEHGGTYHNAKVMFEKYGPEAINIISLNPYTLMYSGAAYETCEQMAKESGMPAHDKKRTRAVVEHAISINKKNGNTKIEIDQLYNLIRKEEDKTGCGYVTNKEFVAEEVCADNYKLSCEEGKLYVYATEDYQAETVIVKNIQRLLSSAIPLNPSRLSTSEIQARCRVEYSNEQLEAFDISNKSGVYIVTGGPGTGKTTWLNGFLMQYEASNPGKQILLCAPTGCAAMQMQEHTGRLAMTVHKALNIKPYEADMLVSKEELLEDCVVLDESSMVDTVLFARLVSAIKSGALLIIMGDKEQLPSVGEGNVLADLLESGRIKEYCFKKIFRQGDKNLIIDNAHKIIEGDASLRQNDNFRILRFSDEDKLKEEVISIAKQYYAEEDGDFKLYTPSKNRKFKTGSINLNRALRLARFTAARESVTYGYYTFSVGDKVLFNRNNYDKGYYNGLEGTVCCLQQHGGTYYISIRTDDDEITLSGTEMEDIELSYAMTAHKAQGGECDTAVIVVPFNPVSLLKRKLLYVEVTRAKKNVIILSEKNALERAIGTRGDIKRTTGLKEKLLAM